LIFIRIILLQYHRRQQNRVCLGVVCTRVCVCVCVIHQRKQTATKVEYLGKKQTKKEQTKQNQIKSNQIKSNQIKSNQIKSNQNKTKQNEPKQTES
jgi:hypothetical protein